jgi:flagellar basal-body rod protein FlgC
MLDILDISATGLTANRHRLTAISNNIANMHTTRAGFDAEGKPIPYARRTTLMNTRGGRFSKTMQGVQAKAIVDHRAGKKIYSPDHPDADELGYVRMPNVNIVTEYVDAMLASRAYEANAQVMNITKSMMNTAIRVLA